eukprot:6143171-Pyramimonas_sp.AAC.1
MGLKPLERLLTLSAQQNGPSARGSKAHPATSEVTSLQLESRRQLQGLSRVPTGMWPRAAKGGAPSPAAAPGFVRAEHAENGPSARGASIEAAALI